MSRPISSRGAINAPIITQDSAPVSPAEETAPEGLVRDPIAVTPSSGFGWLRSLGAWLGFGSPSENAAVLGTVAGITGKQGASLDRGPIGLPADPIEKLLHLRGASSFSRDALVNNHSVTAGNRSELLVDGEAAFASMMEAIDQAKDWINVSFFIFKDDKYGRAFADKLAEKAAQGVKVRVMLDEGGSMLGEARGEPKVAARLRKAGVEVINNYFINGAKGELLSSPDHRKIVAVDGKVAFTGGVNIGSPYLDLWHDLMVKVEGPAVHQLSADFLTTWLHRGGTLDPASTVEEVRARYFPEPNTYTENTRVKISQSIPGESDEILRNYLAAIDAAEGSIDIISPYVTSAEIQDALRRAAERGVAVRLIVPAANNHFFCDLAARSTFPALINSGVEIYEYPGMVHAKLMVIDAQKTIIGTANLDDISLKRAYEVNLEIDDPKFAATVANRVLAVDLASSKPLDCDAITTFQRVAGGFWNRMFSSFL